MARALEFISVDLEAVRGFFADGEASAVEALIKKGEQIFDVEDEEERAEEHFVWGEIIRSLAGGSLGKYLAAQKPLDKIGATNDSISEMKSVAMAAVVRHFGESIAGVFHSISAGDIFRVEPFEYLNRTNFLSRTDAFLLLERPFFNQISMLSPSFGGLTRTELAGIALDVLTNAAPDSEDSDTNVWAGNILTLVEETKQRGFDLVTIYE